MFATKRTKDEIPKCSQQIFTQQFVQNRDLNKGGAGGAIAPTHFGTIEGAAGQRRRAALLLAPPL